MRELSKQQQQMFWYVARASIFAVFGVNFLLYLTIVVITEIFSIALFLGYQLVRRAENRHDDKDVLNMENTSQSDKANTLLGLEFAPAMVPLSRRIQTLAVAFCAFTFMFTGVIFTLITFSLLFTKYYWISLLYAGWYLYDFRSHEQGGHRVQWFRHWRFWKFSASYFPIRLVKTAELPADRNYIIGCHPHGIMAAGSFSNFATEGTGFSDLFPGISPHLMTLTMNFVFPFYRELVLGLGVVSVGKKSLEWILKMKGVGNAAVIVVGGAQEALDAHRNSDVALTITSRKGFIRMALINGADLVPVFSFGENNVFDQAANPPGSKLRSFQIRVKEIVGFSPPAFYGRGLFQYTCGFIPFRSEITTVVGAPIRVEHVPNPTQQQVDELHAKYVAALKDLFETHKTDPHQKLTLY